MRRWLFMLGGLLVWAVHFLGVYSIASVFDVVARADIAPSRIGVGLLTLVCACADVLILAAALRLVRRAGDEADRFIAYLAAASAGLSLIAVLWQGLPAALGH